MSGDEEDFQDVEAPWDVAGSGEQAQVGGGSAHDEDLFVVGDSGGGAAEGSAGPGFDFHKGEDQAVAHDDIHFSPAGSPVVPVEDFAAMGVEPAGGEGFAMAAHGVLVRDLCPR